MYDPEWIERAKPFHGPDRVRDKPGYTHEYAALAVASWYLEHQFAKGNEGSNHKGLYSWESVSPETPEAPLAMAFVYTGLWVKGFWEELLCA